jgi:Flp pilus assembly protein CpaB
MSLTRIPLPRILLALALGVATFFVVRPALGPPPDAGPLVDVHVVARPVAAGVTLVTGDVQSARLPAGSLPDAEPAPAPVGSTARVDLIPGEVVLAVRLGPRGLAALLPAGARALAVPRAAGTPPLEPGQRTDLLAAGRVVVPAAAVLAVDDSGTTVAVPEAAAPAVAEAIAAGAVTLSLAG